MNEYVAMILGVLCAGAGGELFVRGTVGIAHWARIAPGIIGASVAAFATSSPELSVAINSALAGEPELSLGDALGSNVVNVALILALALTISGIQCPRGSIKRDFPIALMAPAAIGLLLWDGILSRYDGIALLCLFLAWLGATVDEARKQRSSAEAVLGERRAGLAWVACLVGLALLITAGKLIVTGASRIALAFGVDEFIVGATVVAIGTSAPELAATIVAKLRGHDEVGLGTILGSNIFNGFFIVAVAAIIHPISVDWRETVETLAFGFTALILTLPSRSGYIGRWRGALLLVLYAGYLAVVLQKPAG